MGWSPGKSKSLMSETLRPSDHGFIVICIVVCGANLVL